MCRRGCCSCCPAGCTGEFQCQNLLLDHPQPALFVTAQWSWHPIVYVVYRWVWMVFFLVWLILSALLPYAGGDIQRQRLQWITYLTSWAYIVLTMSIVISACTALWYFIVVKRDGKPMVRRMPWYLQLQWFFYNVATVYALGVTTGFWAFYWKYGEGVNAISFNTHVFNSVYVIADLCITATPIRILHVWHPIILGFLYLAFAMIYQAIMNTEGVVYQPINFYGDPGLAGLFVGVGFLLLLLLWACIFGVFVLRGFLSRRKCPCGRDYIGPDGGEGGNVEDTYVS